VVVRDHRPAWPPYPQSPVIVGIEWAPKSQIIRKAAGSDNWAMAWGKDGNLYTAYGDGWGFEPKVNEKLSLGFAVVAGVPPAFSGATLRSASGEQPLPDGRRGKKASGLLSVGGVLYMWVRNADRQGNECQLASSADSAKTWTWSSWTYKEFGYCTFLNFGKNYAGARDEYVYTYSHDGPSAYRAADRMILMRVPQDKIMHRAAYEFFSGLSTDGTPTWSSNIDDRAAVFQHGGRVLRSGISYNMGLKRYIWWQQLPRYGSHGSDTRHNGGFGVYDAPEPWGPWTTVYFTESWDVGPGETGRFPPKWMSLDGKTMYLVFSGDDSFSVRKATLTVADHDAQDPRSNPK